MGKIPLSRLFLAGLIATFAMTLIAYAGPAVGLRRLDYAGTLARWTLGYRPAMYSAGWWMGMVAHAINGIVLFPLVYVILLEPRLPGPPAVRGLACGVILWLFSEALSLPVLGGGFFSSRVPRRAAAVMGSLVTHLVYGLLLGALARPRTTRARAHKRSRD